MYFGRGLSARDLFGAVRVQLRAQLGRAPLRNQPERVRFEPVQKRGQMRKPIWQFYVHLSGGLLRRPVPTRDQRLRRKSVSQRRRMSTNRKREL